MYRAYEKWSPRGATLTMVDQARDIAEEYERRGYSLTLRQLYYQFVARGLIPNKQSEYNRLGQVVNRARMAGLIDWSHIEDRTRNMRQVSAWNSPAQLMRIAAQQYRMRKWERQPSYVEVWVEKEALAGVIEQVADRYEVPWFACRGYVSASEEWNAAQRLRERMIAGKNVLVLHLGDHDPSGVDMTRDNRSRLKHFMAHDALYENEIDGGNDGGLTFAEVFKRIEEEHGGTFELRRIALNWDQVQEYEPPPNPAKLTDSRADKYIEAYGMESWELDALPPDVLDALIASHIDGVRDDDLWFEDTDQQEEERGVLNWITDNWSEVKELADAR